MIVEDEATARKAISTLLKKSGYRVLEASSVAEGVSVLPEKPDWIVLDLMLPDGSGLAILAKLRKEGIPAKVCVVSGCHEHMLEQARDAGADHVFSKPLDFSHLAAALAAK